jgi:hypothetical protein
MSNILKNIYIFLHQFNKNIEKHLKNIKSSMFFKHTQTQVKTQYQRGTK